MSSRTITIEHDVDDVPTPYDAPPVLRDPTAAFGVRRTDTGAVVVAAGTPFVVDGPGRYSYVVAGIDAGVEYEAFVEAVYGGEVKRQQVVWTADPDADGYRYATPADVILQFGEKLIVEWSNLNPKQSTVDAARLDRAIFDAQDEVDRLLGSSPYVTPLADMSPATARQVRRLTCQLALVWLFDNRPGKDVDAEGRPRNQGAGMRKEATRVLGLIAVGHSRIDARRHAAGPTGPRGYYADAQGGLAP